MDDCIKSFDFLQKNMSAALDVISGSPGMLRLFAFCMKYPTIKPWEIGKRLKDYFTEGGEKSMCDGVVVTSLVSVHENLDMIIEDMSEFVEFGCDCVDLVNVLSELESIRNTIKADIDALKFLIED